MKHYLILSLLAGLTLTAHAVLPITNHAKANPVAPPVVDKIKPLLKVSTKIPMLTTKAQLIVKGTASDASGIGYVGCRFGGRFFKYAVGTTNWQVDLPLKKGKNTLIFVARDRLGNTKLTRAYKITRK
jgi:hypothetical protein